MNRISYGLTALLLLSLWSGNMLAESKVKRLNLQVGEVHILGMQGVKRVALGSPKNVSYKTLDDGQVMLVGLEPGESSLHVWRNGGREERFWVTVFSRYISESVRIAKTLTNKIEGIDVYSLDGRLVVEGKINKKEIPSIEAVRALVPDAVFIIENRPFQKSQTVRVDAVLVEIGNNDLKKIGIEWDTTASGPIYGFHKDITPANFRLYQDDPEGFNGDIIDAIPLGDTSFFQYFGITSHIASTLNFLESSGKARILSAPKLTTVSGQEASFHIGGQYPIPVINAVGALSVEKEDYGVILEVLPTVDDDIIDLKVSVDLSDIDPSVTVNGVPGTRNRRTETVVQLKNNQTIAISGLFSVADTDSNTGLPILSQIPILKYFFGVEDSDIENRQVVVLLTPKLVTPGDEDDRALSRFAKDMMSDNKSQITIDAALLE